MQALIDILVRDEVIVELVVDTYTKLFESLSEKMILYNPTTEEFSTYNLLSEGVRSHYYEINANNEIVDLLESDQMNKIEFEIKAKLVLSKYVVYKFRSFVKYCIKDTKPKTQYHSFTSVTISLIQNYEAIPETTNLENIYVLMLSADEEGFHKYKFNMLSNLSNADKLLVECGPPIFDLTTDIYRGVNYIGFSLKSTGSYI